jgi:hypothetical protein
LRRKARGCAAFGRWRAIIRMAPKERVDKGDIQGMKPEVGVIAKHASDTIQKYCQSARSVPMPKYT